MKDPKRELEKARSRFAQKEDKKKFFRKPTKKEVYRGFFSILVFLIILGGLFGLAEFARQEMQSSSRINTTKTIHAQTVKYISAETMGCTLGETTMMNGNLTCSELNAANVVAAAVKTLTDKNPYSTKNNAVRISTSNTKDEDVGYINLSASGSDVVVKSCHTKPCSDEDNRKSDTIEIK